MAERFTQPAKKAKAPKSTCVCHSLHKNSISLTYYQINRRLRNRTRYYSSQCWQIESSPKDHCVRLAFLIFKKRHLTYQFCLLLRIMVIFGSMSKSYFMLPTGSKRPLMDLTVCR